MRLLLFHLTFLCVALIPGLLGQSLESIVRNAVSGAFRRQRAARRSAPPPPSTGAGFLLSDIDTMQGPPPSRGVPSAISSLNAFAQNNAPEMNQLLDSEANAAADAIRNITSELMSRRDFGRFAFAPNAEFAAGTMKENLRSVTENREVQDFLRIFLLEEGACPIPPDCDIYDPYRTADGSCNNLDKPLLGRAFTAQNRLIDNAYDDNMQTPRTRSSNGRYLPSARLVSNALFDGYTPNSATHTTYLTHFGQFIDHDVISTPTMIGPNGPIEDCCQPRPQYPHLCIPIQIPKNDPIFQGLRCMNMVRRAAILDNDCKNGKREQNNQRSSFIDGTAVYGWNRTREIELRLYSGGLLAESSYIKGLLPEGPCRGGVTTTPPVHCFKAGDHRQSETPTLTVIHTMWVRRHNLIADALRRATRITDDETLFQEAKRIVVAELQHITYNEYLPKILNKDCLIKNKLLSRAFGHDNTYNDTVDPRTFNSFGAAVFRMGHTLVRNVVGYDNGRRGVQRHLIKDHFRKPDLMFRHYYGYEYMARWMSKAPKSRSDRTIVDGLRNRLFEGPPGPNTAPGETLALDLGALNIQRGREQGLPPYNAYREYCGRHPAYHFGSGVLGGLVDHTPQNAARLASVYRSPHDIDLYAGGLTEKPVDGGILGPTFSCLFAEQFKRYKFGDRFWYENIDHVNPLAAFTAEQLAQIKQITMSKVLCSVVKNDKGPVRFQPSLFERSILRGNHQRECWEILKGNRLGFDIRPFADQLMQLRGRRRRGPIIPRGSFHGPSPLRPSSWFGRRLPLID